MRKTVMSIGTGSCVQIAAKQDRRMASGIPEPVGAKKRGGLDATHGGCKSEVSVDHLNGVTIHVDLDPEGPSAFLFLLLPARGKASGLDKANGITTENGVAVSPFLDVKTGVEMEVHIQFRCDHVYLVKVTRSTEPDIEFLECHDIRFEPRDYTGYPQGHILPIVTDAAVYVVGHDRKGHRYSHGVKIGSNAPFFKG